MTEGWASIAFFVVGAALLLLGLLLFLFAPTAAAAGVLLVGLAAVHALIGALLRMRGR